MTPTPPPTTTTPTLADLITYHREFIADNPKWSDEYMQGTLDVLLAHESALRREAVLRGALRDGLAERALTCAFHAQADDDSVCCCGKPRGYHWKFAARAALADSGSGG